MLLILMIMSLSLLAGIAFYFHLSKKSAPEIPLLREASGLIVLSPLEITILKKDSGTESLYGKLKIQISLQTPDKKSRDYIQTCSAQYLDTANELLSGKKLEDFQDSNPDLLAQKQLKLKQELLAAFNTLSSTGRIQAVFFNEFFIQEI